MNNFKETEMGKIPKNWEELSINDFSDVIGGGTPSTKKEDYWNGDIPWITPKDLSNFNNRFISHGERNITKKGLENSSAKLLPKGTILLSSRAPVGYLGIASNQLTTNQGFRSLIPKLDKITNIFLFYLLKNNVEYLKSQSTGTTFGELSGSTLKSIKFILPPLPEQTSIARILSSLDDKIELNNAMNKTLEETAQTLFKRWYIDFEFSNENGEPYKSSDGEMIDSELGLIPKGWKIDKLDNHIDTISETHKFDCDKIIFLNTSDIIEGEILNHNYSDINSLPGQAKKSIKKNDILFSEIRPANRRYAYIDFDADNYVVSTKLMVLRSKSFIDPIVIYYFLKSNTIINELQKLAEARSGTFPQITFNQVKNLKYIIPDIKYLDIYTKILKSIFYKIKKNHKEIKILSQIRDALLPKLMSGEIRVKIG